MYNLVDSGVSTLKYQGYERLALDGRHQFSPLPVARTVLAKNGGFPIWHGTLLLASSTAIKDDRFCHSKTDQSYRAPGSEIF